MLSIDSGSIISTIAQLNLASMIVAPQLTDLPCLKEVHNTSDGWQSRYIVLMLRLSQTPKCCYQAVQGSDAHVEAMFTHAKVYFTSEDCPRHWSDAEAASK